MTTKWHDRVSQLFAVVCDLPAQERRAYLEREAPDDPALRAQVEALVVTDRSSDDFLHTPALGEDFKVQEAQSAQLGPDAALVGEVLGSYRLTRIIATGGMGTVYEAQQDDPQRTVAVKVIRQSLMGRSGLRRFRYESQTLARLRHPGIAQVYETGTHRNGAGLAYFVMEYVPDAQPITEFARKRMVGLRERIELYIRVCEAVHHGHQKGVIHRDLKPANILVDPEGQSKIIDFGVARATNSDVAVTTMRTDVGQLVGTLQYMSPEQCESDPHDLDTRSDVYALGVVLFELLCDQLPYDLSNATVAIAVRVIQESVPAKPGAINRALRGDLETIVLKALQKERDRRYSSAAELAADLRRHLNNDPIEARPPSALYRLSKFAKRNRGLVGAIGAVFVVLVAGIVTTSLQAIVAEQAKGIAQEQRAMAETEKALAEAVYEFMHHTLTAFTLGDHEVTLRQVLDGAAATIDGEFPDQPLVEAEVRNMIQAMYHRLGEYDLAEPHAREMVAIRQRELGEEDPQTLDAMNCLATVFGLQGKYTEAEPVFRQILESRRRVLGEEHNLTVETMNNLGTMLQEDGRANEAEPLLRRAVEGHRRIFGDDAQGTLSSMNNLALVLSSQGKLAEAEPLYQQVLEIRRRTLGNEHPDSIASRNNLAWHLVDMGKPAEAEPLFREAVELVRHVQGEAHPWILNTTSGLARALREMGRFDEAEQLLRQTLETVRSHQGNEHSTTLRAMHNLALLLQKAEEAQKFAEAEPLLREALEIRRRTQGDQHPATVTVMYNLAWQRWKQGGLDEAEPLFDQALELYRQVKGEEHPQTLHALHNYAGLLGDLDRPAEAEEVCRQVLEVRRRVLGDENPATLQSMNHLATLYHKQGRNEEAEPLFRQVLEVHRRLHGEEHSNTIVAMVNVASAWRDMGKLDQAEVLFSKALETAKRVLPTGDRMIAKCQRGYGACLTKLERFPDAEEHLLAAYERLKETLGDGEQQTLQRLVELYEAWGKSDQAAQWRAKLPEPTEVSEGE